MDRKAMKKMFLSNKMAVVCTVLILIIVIASFMAPPFSLQQASRKNAGNQQYTYSWN